MACMPSPVVSAAILQYLERKKCVTEIALDDLRKACGSESWHSILSNIGACFDEHSPSVIEQWIRTTGLASGSDTPSMAGRAQTLRANGQFIESEVDVGRMIRDGRSFVYCASGVCGAGYYLVADQTADQAVSQAAGLTAGRCSAQDHDQGDSRAASRAAIPAANKDSVQAKATCKAPSHATSEAAMRVAVQAAEHSADHEPVQAQIDNEMSLLSDTEEESDGGDLPLHPVRSTQTMCEDVVRESDREAQTVDHDAHRRVRARTNSSSTKDSAGAAAKSQVTSSFARGSSPPVGSSSGPQLVLAQQQAQAAIMKDVNGQMATNGKDSRKRRPWTADEEEQLRVGVSRQGEGNWEAIRLSFDFPGRTNVDLKDKWRNMRKSGRADAGPSRLGRLQIEVAD